MRRTASTLTATASTAFNQAAKHPYYRALREGLRRRGYKVRIVPVGAHGADLEATDRSGVAHRVAGTWDHVRAFLDRNGDA